MMGAENYWPILRVHNSQRGRERGATHSHESPRHTSCALVQLKLDRPYTCHTSPQILPSVDRRAGPLEHVSFFMESARS